MAFDPHANLAYATVTTAPSPADSGLTLEVTNADAAQFPDPAVDGEYNCTDWAAQEIPIKTNSEIIRITAKAAAPSPRDATHTQFTIERTQEGSNSRNILVGDQLALTITKKVVDDIENRINEDKNYFYRQAIINGNFDIWQRGTSFTTVGYSADMWRISNLNGSFTTSRQSFTVGQTDVPNNPKYFFRTVKTTAGGADDYHIIRHRIEGVRSFAGKNITLSFYAKADASKNITIEFEQNFGTGGSPSSPVSTIGVNKIALTTSWAKYTITVAIPSISGKTLGTNGNDFLMLSFWTEAGSNLNARLDSLGNQSGTFDFSQVQINEGDTALDFMPKTYGEELRACQRYYYNVTNIGGTADTWAAGHCTATTTAIVYVKFSQQMRATPTISFSGLAVGNSTGSRVNVTNAIISGSGLDGVRLNLTVASGLTAGNATLATFQTGATNYVAFSAEL